MSFDVMLSGLVCLSADYIGFRLLGLFMAFSFSLSTSVSFGSPFFVGILGICF
jgi:hypothetical protein